MPQLRHRVPPHSAPPPPQLRVVGEGLFSLTQRNDGTGDRSPLGLPLSPTIFLPSIRRNGGPTSARIGYTFVAATSGTTRPRSSSAGDR